jgi:hypothetical protein
MVESDKATSSIIIFSIITVGFFIGRYILVDKKYDVDNFLYTVNQPKSKEPSKSALDAIMTISYFALIIIIQLSLNSQIIMDKCHNYPQSAPVMFNTTIIPNVLILGLIYFILTLMPSWKYPFSYVFGFVSSKLRKAWEALKDPTKPQNPLHLSLWTKAFGSESSKFIKKITRENFNEFFRKSYEMDGLLKKPSETHIEIIKAIGKKDGDINYIVAENDEDRLKLLRLTNPTSLKDYTTSNEIYNNIKQLYQYTVRKDLIATCIWFLLAGFLVINVSQDTIHSIECEYTAEELREISEKQKALI